MRFDIFGIILFVIAAVLFGYSGVLSKANSAIHRSGKRTNALITDVLELQTDMGHTHYATSIKYNVNGKDYEAHLPESKHKLGDKDGLIQILYLPSAPERYEVHTNDKNAAKARAITILAAVISVIGVALIIIYFVKG